MVAEAAPQHLEEAWVVVEEVQSPEALGAVEAVEAVRRCLAWAEEAVLRCSALVGAAESIVLA
jgi:hypothetical protein